MKKSLILLLATFILFSSQTVYAENGDYQIKNLVLTADGVSGCNLTGNSKLVRASWDMVGTASDYFFDTSMPGVETPDFSTPGSTSRYLWDASDGSPIAGVWKFQVRDYPDTGLRSEVCTYTWEDVDGTGTHGTTTVSLDTNETEPDGQTGTTQDPVEDTATTSEDDDGDDSEEIGDAKELETRLESEVNDIGTALFVIAGVCSLLTLGFVALVVFQIVRSRKSRNNSVSVTN